MLVQAWGSAASERRALALHGFLDNSSTFDLIAPTLAEVNQVKTKGSCYCGIGDWAEGKEGGGG